MILSYTQGCFMKLLFVTLTLLLVNAVPASAQIESVGAASPAHPSSASAVVRQFYAWYMKMPKKYGSAFGTDYLAPARGLFDDRLYWLLKQENKNHPGSKPRGMECSLDADPFGLGNGPQRLMGFTLGAPIAQNNAVVVPVFLGGFTPGPPVSRPKITAIVRDEGGAYKIYDISAYGALLRQGLESQARDPNCAWPK